MPCVAYIPMLCVTYVNSSGLCLNYGTMCAVRWATWQSQALPHSERMGNKTCAMLEETQSSLTASTAWRPAARSSAKHSPSVRYHEDLPGCACPKRSGRRTTAVARTSTRAYNHANKIAGIIWPLLGSRHFKLKTIQYNPGDMAWRRRISRCFYPINLVLNTGLFGLQSYSERGKRFACVCVYFIRARLCYCHPR